MVFRTPPLSMIKIVQERKLRMVSHVDLTTYSDEKAMKILSNQWKCHDPTGTYWPAVQECYTLMTVGNVPRNIPATTTDVDPPPRYPSAARAQDCPTDSERGGMQFDGRQFAVERRLLAPPRRSRWIFTRQYGSQCSIFAISTSPLALRTPIGDLSNFGLTCAKVAISFEPSLSSMHKRSTCVYTKDSPVYAQAILLCIHN